MDPILALDLWFAEQILNATRDELVSLCASKLALKREWASLTIQEATARAAAFLERKRAA
jgi:hypothetical protein